MDKQPGSLPENLTCTHFGKEAWGPGTEAAPSTPGITALHSLERVIIFSTENLLFPLNSLVKSFHKNQQLVYLLILLHITNSDPHKDILHKEMYTCYDFNFHVKGFSV